jgi:hypothetical protein
MVITWSRLKLPAGRAFLFLLILSAFSCDTPILKLSHSSGENLKGHDPDYEGQWDI